MASPSVESKFHCNLSFAEINEEELDRIESGMYPGGCSYQGFLLPGEKLRDVVKKDRETLAELGITYKQISDILLSIHGKYKRMQTLAYGNGNKSAIFGSALVVDGRYEVSEMVYMGAQECPFQNKAKDPAYHGYQYGDRDITIKDMNSGQIIVYNSLLPHMIKEHQFFESPNCSHRLDPVAVVRMFDMEPGKNYELQKKSYLTWSTSSSSSQYLTDVEKRFLDLICVSKMDASANLKTWLLPDNHLRLLFLDSAMIAEILDHVDMNKDIDPGHILHMFRLKEREDNIKRNQQKLSQMAGKPKDYNPYLVDIPTDEEMTRRMDTDSRIREEFNGTIGLNNYQDYLLFVESTDQRFNTKVFGMPVEGYSGYNVYSCRKCEYYPLDENDTP
eukprot:Pompholyxophrys_sp_v1_NODE_3_length_18401_cov_4.332280.p4 type:complete len:389 gc:universal NODE_3_length_18401_cov_4.332280:7999-9165(+)